MKFITKCKQCASGAGATLSAAVERAMLGQRSGMERIEAVNSDALSVLDSAS